MHAVTARETFTDEDRNVLLNSMLALSNGLQQSLILLSANQEQYLMLVKANHKMARDVEKMFAPWVPKVTL